MGDETATFFEDLGRRGRDPLLAKATGRALFDAFARGPATPDAPRRARRRLASRA